jgi:hypothetical protein
MLVNPLAHCEPLTIATPPGGRPLHTQDLGLKLEDIERPGHTERKRYSRIEGTFYRVRILIRRS